MYEISVLTESRVSTVDCLNIEMAGLYASKVTVVDNLVTLVTCHRTCYSIAGAMRELDYAPSYSQKTFLNAYYENRDIVNYHLLEGHPSVVCISHLFSKEAKWEGTPAGILHELQAIAPRLNLHTIHKSRKASFFTARSIRWR